MSSERLLLTNKPEDALWGSFVVSKTPEHMHTYIDDQRGRISSVDDVVGSQFITIIKDIPDRKHSMEERLNLRFSAESNNGVRFSLDAGESLGQTTPSLNVEAILYTEDEENFGSEIPHVFPTEENEIFRWKEFPIEDGVAYLGGVKDTPKNDTTEKQPYIIEVRGKNSKIHECDYDEGWSERPIVDSDSHLIGKSQMVACTDHKLIPTVLKVAEAQRLNQSTIVIGASRWHSHNETVYYDYSQYEAYGDPTITLQNATHHYGDHVIGQNENHVTYREIHGNTELKEHMDLIAEVGREKFWEMVGVMEEMHKRKLQPFEKSTILRHLLTLETKFEESLILSQKLAERSNAGQREFNGRIALNNPEMKDHVEWFQKHLPDSTKIFVLDGIVVESQRAGLKRLVGSDETSSMVVNDVLQSATSLNLGAENPWISAIDMVENTFGIRDNMCVAYHPGLKQRYGLDKLIAQYPQDREDLSIYSESSATMVNSMAIESSLAYVDRIRFDLPKGNSPEEKTKLFASLEKLKKQRQENNLTLPKILAIKGTWHGGSGPAREGTAFNASSGSDLRQEPSYVDRCLPLPTRENMEEFLSILAEKVEAGEAGGIIMETVVGDAGIVEADPEIVTQALEILKNAKVGSQKIELPFILDATQQQARMDDYWGVSHIPELQNYNNLIVTTAKSASNGQPFGFAVIPNNIAQSAYPYSNITTNQLNGAILRAALVADIVNDPRIRNHIETVGNMMEQVASEYEVELRGRGMNRGIFTGNAELMEISQFSLLLNRGILVGALPSTIRFQPCLLENQKTVELLLRSTLEEWKKVENGELSESVKKAVDASNEASGLNM